ncbi:MAG: tetratricopeptide repeat protein [Candidatus Obscuribacterales bacterium]|nr:tetratricopeptide repeat protein [Candidatus Obscuribacterales bacterium]
MHFNRKQFGNPGLPQRVARGVRSLLRAPVPVSLCASFLVCSAAWAVDPAFSAAVQSYQQGKYAAALVQFQVVSQKYPSDPLTRYYMGLCYQHTNQVTQAQQMYQWVEQNARSQSLKAQARAGLESMNKYSQNRSHRGAAPTDLPPPPSGKPDDPKADPKDPKAPKTADAKKDEKGAMKCKKVIQFTSSSSNDQRTLQLFGPFWDAAQQKFQGKVEFQIVDVDNSSSEAMVKKYTPSTYPHLVYLDKDGKVLSSQGGASGDITGTIEGFK